MDDKLAVPTELLDLHVQLEQAGVSPEEFKEVYGDGARDESAVGGEAPEEQETGDSR